MEKTELKSNAYDCIVKIESYLREVEKLKLELKEINQKINEILIKEGK